MSAAFDLHVAVDWSARAAPSPAKPCADAIWIGVAGRAAVAHEVYERTRAAAVARLRDLLHETLRRGRRVLVGFDFPFGYPTGFAARLVGTDRALAVWDWLAERVADGPDNANDRYGVAAGINAAFGGGPFWGRPATRALPHLPERKSDRRDVGLPEFRLVERRAAGAKSCWQLAYAGSVGRQALLGLAALGRLRREADLAGSLQVWPFDTGLAAPDAPIVFAEIYPSLLRKETAAARRAGEPLDAAQVRTTAAALAALDAAGGLAPLFGAVPDLDAAERACVAREEGWILGAGHADALRRALAA
jgi:hypothetical protein